MTTISAVLDTHPAVPPAAVASPSSSIQTGSSFEAALTQALANPAPSNLPSQIQAHVQGSVQAQAQAQPPAAQLRASATSAPDPALAVGPTSPDDDSTTVSLPSEAIAAFLAVFLAMAGQAVADNKPVQSQVEGASQVADAAGVDGNASTADELRSMLDALRQTQTNSQQDGDGAEGVFAAVVQQTSDNASQTNPTDQLLVLVDRLAAHIPSTSGHDLDGAFEDAVQRLDELGSKAVDLGDALGQVATAAAGIARELSAANGSVVQNAELGSKAVDLGDALGQVATAAAGIARELSAANGSVVQNAALPGQAPLVGVQAVGGARLVDAVEAARSLVQVAELGQSLNLGGTRGKSQIAVQLQPGSLGKLQIEIERTSTGVTARIEASTAAGREAVETNLGQIKDALAAAGVSVDSIDVDGPDVGQSVPKTQVEGARSEGTEQSKTEVGSASGQNKVGQNKVEAGPKARTVEEALRTQSTDDAADAVTISVPVASAANTTRVESANAPQPAVSPEALRLVSDIADQVSLLNGQGKSEFNLQLRPESLGRLHMRLSFDDGAVTVRMQAESAEAKGMIESNLGQLKQSFHEQGIRVDRFVVEVSQGQFSQPDSQHPRRSRGLADDVRGKSTRGGEDFAEALATASDVRPVDYRA